MGTGALKACGQQRIIAIAEGSHDGLRFTVPGDIELGGFDRRLQRHFVLDHAGDGEFETVELSEAVVGLRHAFEQGVLEAAGGLLFGAVSIEERGDPGSFEGSGVDGDGRELAPMLGHESFEFLVGGGEHVD